MPPLNSKRSKLNPSLNGSGRLDRAVKAGSQRLERIARLGTILHNVKPFPQASLNNQVFKVSGSGDWGTAVLADDPSDLPTFPIECLPNQIGDWAAAVSENSQTPIDLAGMLSLSAVAVAVAKKVIIQPDSSNPDYTEPVNIWTCVPLGSANRKSFVVNMARQPFDSYLKCYKQKYGPTIAVKRQELAALEKRKNALTDCLAKAESHEDEKKIKDELKSCIRKISDIDAYEPRFFADDITPERLVGLMSQHGGRIGILSDEGGCFDHFAGIYSKRPNIDVYLHGHSGGTIYRDRQLNGEEICVENAALTLGISPQPQVIAGMSSKDRLQGRGLLARFLWSFPRSTLGSRDWTPASIPSSAKRSYADAITELLDWPPKAAIKITLSKGAFADWIAVAELFEKQLGDEGSLSSPGIQEWTGKLPGAIARIGLLLHCLAGIPLRSEISAATMRRAICIGEYLVPHAQCAFKLLRTDPASDAARVLEKWIVNRATQGQTKFTKSQAQQNHKSRFPNISDMDKPLQVLIDRHICRSMQREFNGPGRPSIWYEINPSLAKP